MLVLFGVCVLLVVSCVLSVIVVCCAMPVARSVMFEVCLLSIVVCCVLHVVCGSFFDV